MTSLRGASVWREVGWASPERREAAMDEAESRRIAGLLGPTMIPISSPSLAFRIR
jgi:hypothetical protein